MRTLETRLGVDKRGEPAESVDKLIYLGLSTSER